MRWLLPLLALTLLSACGPRTLRVVMADQNNSGQKGYADIVEAGTAVDISMFITRSLVDTEQSAHVHTGRCGEIGGVKVGLSTVVPSPSDDTLAQSISTGVAIGFDELTNGGYALNVHDATDHSLYVSCGNIN